MHIGFPVQQETRENVPQKEKAGCRAASQTELIATALPNLDACSVVKLSKKTLSITAQRAQSLDKCRHLQAKIVIAVTPVANTLTECEAT